MVTTIQVEEETRRRLFRIITKMEAETGRRISYDEALNVLLRCDPRVQKARREFLKMFGSLKGGEKVLDELAEFKREERIKLEKKYRRFSKSPSP